jgi:hypothetical protein
MGLVHGWTDAAVAMDGINSGALQETEVHLTTRWGRSFLAYGNKTP